MSVLLKVRAQGKKTKMNKSQQFEINSTIKESPRYIWYQKKKKKKKKRASTVSLLWGNLMGLEVKQERKVSQWRHLLRGFVNN